MFAASILTLFPEMFPGPLGLSLAGDALQRGLWSCQTLDIRLHGIGRTLHFRIAGVIHLHGPLHLAAQEKLSRVCLRERSMKALDVRLDRQSRSA